MKTKYFRFLLVTMALVLTGVQSGRANQPADGDAPLAKRRALANLHTIARFALVFNGVENREPASLAELLSVPYSPFQPAHFVNPYSGTSLHEWDPDRIWSVLEDAGVVAQYGSRDAVITATIRNAGSPPYGTITAINRQGRSFWALISDPDDTRTSAEFLFWAHPLEDRGTKTRPEAPLSPADVKANLHLNREAKTWLITYRKWFSWVKDPAERKLIFLCGEMDQIFRRYVKETRLSGFDPNRWQEALQYSYDNGWANVLNPINPYTGLEMKLIPYAGRTAGDFWIFDRIPTKEDAESMQPRVTRMRPIPFCFGKPPKIVYPTISLVKDMLIRMGEFDMYRESRAYPGWWLDQSQ
jgi:hypothetical protein